MSKRKREPDWDPGNGLISRRQMLVAELLLGCLFESSLLEASSGARAER